MHLTFERNIQVPGIFVILQGIPGDGLSNTIDVAPDFRDYPAQHPPPSGPPPPLPANNTTEPNTLATSPRLPPCQSSTIPRASPLVPLSRSFHPTFLGQGIPSLLFTPSFTWTAGSGVVTTATAPPTTTSSATDHVARNHPSSSVGNGPTGVVVNDESYVFVDGGGDDDDSYDDRSIRGPLFGGSTETTRAPTGSRAIVDSFLQQAIDLWEQELALAHHRAATEWLDSAVLHQRQNAQPSRLSKTIPIISQIVYPTTRITTSSNRNPRWWLSQHNAQLRVFPTLPCPIPSREDEVTDQALPTLPPGTTLVGIALHTFDLQPQGFHRARVRPVCSNSYNEDDYSTMWRYHGQCTRFNGEEYIPPEHSPRPGRIQYLHIESPQPGYILFSIDGYSVLAPGLPSSALFTGLLLQQSENAYGDDDGNEIDNAHPIGTICCCGWWKVTYPDGAVVRQGLDLSTKALYTLPYGAQVQVFRKVVNAMGLSRLLVRAQMVGKPKITGWCSQFLNPMAGQRGAIVQPIPLAVPVWYEIRQPCWVRKEVELSSEVVHKLGIVSATIPVLARHFTEFPALNCVPRLQLAPHAYASLRINAPSAGRGGTRTGSDPDFILEPTGDIDGTFDPAAPGLYHWQNHLKWTRQESGSSASSAMSLEQQVEMQTSPVPPTRVTTHPFATASPVVETAFFSAAELSSVGEESLSSSKSSSSSGTRSNREEPNPPRLCVCCEDKLANATLIHGPTGHICCCLECARIIQARKLGCPICRLKIDKIILHFYA